MPAASAAETRERKSEKRSAPGPAGKRTADPFVTGIAHRVRRRDAQELSWPRPVPAANARSPLEGQQASRKAHWSPFARDRWYAFANAHDACEATRREPMAHHRAQNERRRARRRLRQTSTPPDYRTRGIVPCPPDAARSRDFDRASLQRRIGSALLVSLNETRVGGMPLSPSAPGLARAQRSPKAPSDFLRGIGTAAS